MAVNQFSGLKVLELASVLAGPSVGQFFAELGADVIKVENLRLGGDVTRTWKSRGEKTDDRSAYFCSVNWGKRSVAIDLSTAQGQDIVHQLAVKSDIALVSFKPGDAEKLNIDYKTLSSINPGILYGQITGYGSKNSRVGYDAIIQAEAGFMFMNGEPGGNSLKMPVALVDVLAGHQLKEGLLVAMLQKAKTGQGTLVEVSLIQAAVASLVNQATNWLVNNELPQKQGSAHPNIAPYGDLFKTKDGKELILAVGSDGQFNALCEILNETGLSKSIDYQINPARVRNRAQLKEILNNRISKFSSEELMAELLRRNIPAGIVQHMQDALEQPESRDLIMENQGLKGIRSIVFSSGATGHSHFLPPPHFGEQTSDVLSQFLNYTSETIQELRERKIIN